jgi:serine protease Do
VTVRDSAEMRAGELVLAVGNPMGERNVATMGMLVASPAPPAGNLRAAITLRPGNSGGAMIDAEGRVVGIPHIVMGGGLAQAVSSRAVKRFLQAAGNKKKPVLGVTGHWIDIPETLQQANGLATPAGLLVADVAAGSTAERSGLILGDLILGYGTDAQDPRAIVDLNDWDPDDPAPRMLGAIRAGQLRWMALEAAA